MEVNSRYTRKMGNNQWAERYIKSRSRLCITTFEINRLQNELRALVRLIPAQSLVLDVGCGKGWITALLGSRFGSWKMIGVDISPLLIQFAAKKYPSSIFIVGDATRLPFKSESFDAVIFVAVLHHIPNVGAALKEAVRVLRPNGILFIHEPNKYSYQILFLGAKAPLKRVWGESMDPNERPLDPKICVKFLRKLGLQTHYEGVNIIPFRLLSILPAKIASILDNIDRRIMHVFGSFSIGPGNFRIIAHKVERGNLATGSICQKCLQKA